MRSLLGLRGAIAAGSILSHCTSGPQTATPHLAPVVPISGETASSGDAPPIIPPDALHLHPPLRRRLALHRDRQGRRTAPRAASGGAGVAVHSGPAAGEARLAARGALVEP